MLVRNATLTFNCGYCLNNVILKFAFRNKIEIRQRLCTRFESFKISVQDWRHVAMEPALTVIIVCLYCSLWGLIVCNLPAGLLQIAIYKLLSQKASFKSLKKLLSL